MKIEVTEIQEVDANTELAPVATLHRQLDADGNPTGALSIIWAVKFQRAVPRNQDTEDLLKS
jgi:hypothetical protein